MKNSSVLAMRALFLLVLQTGLSQAATYTIPVGETLTITDPSAYTASDELVVRGTLDLNGQSLKIGKLTNADDNIRTNMTARIVNSSSDEATLTVTSSSAYYGRVEETVGKIHLVLKGNNGNNVFFGPSGAVNASDLTLDKMNFLTYSQYNKLRFVFHRARNDGAFIGCYMIQPTFRGVPVKVSSAEADKTRTGRSPMSLLKFDDVYWSTPDGVTSAVVTLSFPANTRVDGYRIGTAYAMVNDARDWDVYGYHYTEGGWMHLDHRENENLRPAEDAGYRAQLAPNRLFNWPDKSADVLDGAMPISTANGAIVRALTSESLNLGTMTGTGTLRPEDGSELTVADLSGFEGDVKVQHSVAFVATPDNGERLHLKGDATDAPQPVRIREPFGVTVDNAAADTTAKVLFDDSTSADVQYGSLADGEGTLGVVKRGTSVQTIAVQNATYTGDTEIEAGVLRTAATRTDTVVCKAKTVVLQPLAIYGERNFNNNSGYYWGLGELKLFDRQGNEVNISTAGITAKEGFHSTQNKNNLYDGVLSTKMLANGADYDNLPWLKVELAEPVEIGSYALAMTSSGAANDYDKKRTLKNWTVTLTDEDGNVLSEQTDVAPWTASEVNAVKAGQLLPVLTNGVVSPMPVVSAQDSLVTVPQDIWGTVGPYDSSLQSFKARYLRFTVHETLDWTKSMCYGWQLSEFRLYRNGVRQLWPDGTKVGVEYAAGKVSSKPAEKGPQTFADNIVASASDSTHRFYTSEMGPVVVDAGAPVEFDAYSFVTCDQYNNRIPASWTLEVSADSNTWVTVDAQHRANVTVGSYLEQGPWSIAGKYPLLSGGRPNAVGDRSLVRVSSGATFEIASGYEKVGGLTGSGDVLLDKATLDLDPPTDGATFSGSICGRYGACSLRLSGTGVQNFDGAEMVGIGTLDFAGGAIGGSLAVGGALDVTGDVRIAVPSPGEAERVVWTLVSATELTAAAQTAFGNATFALPEGVNAKCVSVDVSATAVRVTVAKRGMILILR